MKKELAVLVAFALLFAIVEAEPSLSSSSSDSDYESSAAESAGDSDGEPVDWSKVVYEPVDPSEWVSQGNEEPADSDGQSVDWSKVKGHSEGWTVYDEDGDVTVYDKDGNIIQSAVKDYYDPYNLYADEESARNDPYNLYDRSNKEPLPAVQSGDEEPAADPKPAAQGSDEEPAAGNNITEQLAEELILDPNPVTNFALDKLVTVIPYGDPINAVRKVIPPAATVLETGGKVTEGEITEEEAKDALVGVGTSLVMEGTGPAGTAADFFVWGLTGDTVGGWASGGPEYTDISLTNIDHLEGKRGTLDVPGENGEWKRISVQVQDGQFVDISSGQPVDLSAYEDCKAGYRPKSRISDNFDIRIYPGKEIDEPSAQPKPDEIEGEHIPYAG